MKRDRRLMRQSFGINEWGLADLPPKVSNIRLAWIVHAFIGRLFPQRSEGPSRNLYKKSLRSWRTCRHSPSTV